MKMVMAIINHDDAHAVISSLTKEGYPVTKLATTGGFLQVGNTTILLGVEDDRLKGALDIIGKKSVSRKQVISTATEAGQGFYAAMPVEVSVGGATVFVLNVEEQHRF